MIRLDARTLTYDVFRDECLIPNRPAIISHAASSLFHDRSPTLCEVTSVHVKEEEKIAAEEAHYLEVMRTDLSPTGLWNLLGPEARVPVYRSTRKSAFSPSTPHVSLSYEECTEMPLREVLLAWAGERSDREEVRGDTSMQTEAPCTKNKEEEQGKKIHFQAKDSTSRQAPVALRPTLLPCTSTFSHAAPDSTSASSPPPSPIRPTYLKDFHFQQLAEQKCGFRIQQAERAEEIEKESKDDVVPSTLPQCRAVSLSTSTPSSALSLSWVATVPHFLGRDWLNEFCRRDTRAWCHRQHSKKEGWNEMSSEEHRCGTCHRGACLSSSFRFGLGNSSSDYRFAYIGSTNTATPLHVDVFGSYSWSLNVSGTKLWYFPSEKSNAHLLTYFFSHSMFPLPPDLRVLSETDSLCCVLQNPGDLIFVPALYLHQVHNQSGEVFPLPSLFRNVGRETEKNQPHHRCGSQNNGVEKMGDGKGGSVELIISVNHNWCNQYNVEAMIQRVFLEQAVRYLTVHSSFSELESMGEWIVNNPGCLAMTETDARAVVDEGMNKEDDIRASTLSFHHEHDSEDVLARVFSPSFLSGRLAMLSLYVDLVLQQGACWSFRGVVAFLTFCHHQVGEDRRLWQEKKKEKHDRGSERENDHDDDGDPKDAVGGGTSETSLPQMRTERSKTNLSIECEERDTSEELARADDRISQLLLRVYKAWEETLRQIRDA